MTEYGTGDRPRVALVGCGRWGRHILRDLIALGCEVPVVARSEASVERAREGGAADDRRATSPRWARSTAWSSRRRPPPMRRWWRRPSGWGCRCSSRSR